jgi:purine-binding chemotaxis protein CheW
MDGRIGEGNRVESEAGKMVNGGDRGGSAGRGSGGSAGRGSGGNLPLSLEALSLTLEAPDADDYDPEAVSILTFVRGNRTFGIEVGNTDGVVECPRITPLPIAPDGIAGVVSVRGRITIVIDAAVEAGRPESKMRLILVRGEGQLGLLADQIQSVIALKQDQLEKVPQGRVSRRLLGAEARGTQTVRLASSYFKHSGRRVPVVDVDLLLNI